MCNLLLTSSFLLSPPKLGGQNYVGPEGLFSTPFFVSLVFSSEPNKRKFNFPPYFPLIFFHPHCFHPNQTYSKGLFGWRNGKVRGWKISGRMEKWEDRKDLVFPHVCSVGGVEKWEGGKLFCLVKEKKGRIKNVVYINCLLCPCYIICKS